MRGVIGAVAAVLAVSPAVATAGDPPAVEWSATYGGLHDARGQWVEMTPEGGYIICGGTNSLSTGPHFFLAAFDSLGERIWDSIYASVSGGAYHLCRTMNGGLAVVGQSEGQATLLKVSPEGAIKWSRDVGADALGDAFSVAQTADSGFIIGGTLAGNLPERGYVHGMSVVKTSRDGAVSWRRVFPEDYSDEAPLVRCVQARDGGFVAAGRKEPLGLRLVKLSPGGGVQWERTYPEVNVGDGRCVQQTADGGFVVTGCMASRSQDSTGDLYLLKTDSLGALTWVRRFGGDGNDEGLSVEQTSDGGCVVAGYSDDAGGEGVSGVVLRTDSLGTLLWSWRPDPEEGGGSVVCARQTPDGGFVVTGAGRRASLTNSVPAFILKLAPEGK